MQNRIKVLAFCLGTLLVSLVAVFGSPHIAEAKTNTVILAGSDWLSGAGVDVYSNDGSYESAEGDLNYVNAIQSGYRWQCVELVNRLYLTRGWTSSTWAGNAVDMFATAPRGFTKEANGSITKVQPGDVVVFGGGWQDYGHVMIVDRVDGSTIHIVSQNVSNPRGTLIWNQGVKTITPWSGYSMTGVVHAPGGSSGGNSGSVAPNGYYQGTPPDGMIIESEDAAHWYVAFGGSLIWFDRNVAWMREALLRERDRRFGWMNASKMTYGQIHAIEYGYGGNRSHIPRDNSFFYEAGSARQYVVQYGHAFSVGSTEEVVYLGGADRAVMVPSGLAGRLSGIPSIPNDVILKAASSVSYHHMVNGTAYWANSFTVIGCIETVKGGRIQPVPGSLVQLLSDHGRISDQPTHCSFPPSWALYGPGGAERWWIEGNNPYVRHRYGSSLALHCRLGSSPAQVQLSDARGINEPPEAEQLGCPNNSFVRIVGNGEVFRVDSGILHYISSPATLTCLTWENNGAVVDIDGAVVATTPRGNPLNCEFEGRMLHAPNGQVDYVKNGSRRHVPAWAVVHCLKGRAGTGDPVNVDQGTFNSYPSSESLAYCPYETESGLNFVQEAGSPTVWLVGPGTGSTPGVRRHVGSLCVPDAYTTQLKGYHVWTVPAGETAGHIIGPDWWSSTADCQALSQG